MKAEELHKDDVLLTSGGNVIYTLLEDAQITELKVNDKVTDRYVSALVKFEADTGTGFRTWDIGTEVPLIRPEKAE